MKIQCPHCASQVEISRSLSAKESTACPACGSLIRIRSAIDTQAQSKTRLQNLSSPGLVRKNFQTEKIPERIGRYKIQEILGQGGMGVVYRAVDTELQREVALKVLLGSETAHAEDMERFFLEAQRLASLVHPNVVQIYDTGQDGTTEYFVMELVEGMSMHTWLYTLKPDLSTILTTMASVADGVHAAHEINLLHRDLKPANILISTSGVPKVMDFGLAKKLDTNDGLTRSGTILGTPEYMSPEQAQSRELDLRSDVFSLGVILYEATTGVRPFYDESLYVTIDRIVSEDPIAPCEIKPGMPRDVQSIIFKAMEKDREQRYESVAEFAADLRRFLRHEPILAQPASMVTRARKMIRRHRTLATALGAVVLSLVLGLLGTLWAWFNAEAARQRARQAEKIAQVALRKAESEEYILRIALARNRIKDNAYDQAHRILMGCPEKLRHWEWNRLKYLLHLNEITLTGFKGIVNSLAVSPDGREILTTGWGNNAKVLAALTGEERMCLQGHNDLVTRVAYSQGSNLMATASRDRTARIWERDSGKCRFTLSGHTAPLTDICFSPAGNRVLTASLDKSVILWNVQTGKRLTRLGPFASGVLCVVFAPDYTRAMIGCADGNVILWNLESGKPVRMFKAHSQAVTALAVSTNGERALTGGYDKQLILWNVETGKRIRTIKDSQQAIFSVAFNTDASRALIASADRVARIIDLAHGRVVREFKGHEREVFAARFFPGEARVVTGSEDFTVRVWNLNQDRGTTILKSFQARVRAIDFSPRGPGLLVVGRDKSVAVIDSATDTVLSSMVNPSTVTCGIFSPDGSRILTGSIDGKVCVWDAKNGRVIGLVTAAGNQEITALAVSPDSRYFAFGTGRSKGRPAKDYGCIGVCDLGRVAILRTITGVGDSVECLVFSADSRSLIAGSVIYNARGENRGQAVIWDVETGNKRLTLTGPDEHVMDAAILPEGGQVITAGIDWNVTGRHNDFFLKLWDVNSGALVHRFAGHMLAARRIACFPDGKRFVSAGLDHALIVWDPRSGREVYRVDDLPLPVNDVAVSSDGSTVAAVLSDGKVYLLPAESRGDTSASF